MKFIIRVLLGIPITFFIVSLLAGGMDNAWIVVVCSLILSFGFALLIWIPLCWVVGSWALALIGIFVKKPDGQQEATRQHPHFRRYEVVLTDFLRKAKDRGMSDDKIVADLRRNGWSDSQVQKARRILDT